MPTRTSPTTCSPRAARFLRPGRAMRLERLRSRRVRELCRPPRERTARHPGHYRVGEGSPSSDVRHTENPNMTGRQQRTSPSPILPAEIFSTAWAFWYTGPRPGCLRRARTEVVMVQMDVVYEGELHCKAVHGPSGAVLTTDAPVDNQGRGASFSPTDLLATSLGVCMMTIWASGRSGKASILRGTRVQVTKEMAADPRRRVSRIGLHFDLPSARSPRPGPGRGTARTCPVALSIHPDLEVVARFHWGSGG